MWSDTRQLGWIKNETLSIKGSQRQKENDHKNDKQNKIILLRILISLIRGD